MRTWTHDELHALMDGDPYLKTKSDDVHNLLIAITLEEWMRRKHLMMEIYKEAVHCKNRDNAILFLDAISYYIRRHTCTLDAWRDIASLPKHRKAIVDLSKAFHKRKLCHTPNSNDYVCFCDERIS